MPIAVMDVTMVKIVLTPSVPAERVQGRFTKKRMDDRKRHHGTAASTVITAES